MIPKIIHYCWFGGNPLPKMAQMCIASWRKYLPDYEIKEWNESNFDINCIPYVKEAYEAKKYAFVSDYARFKILYEEGGLYFDTDVELIRPLDDILQRGAFMGCEHAAVIKNGLNIKNVSVAPGLGLAANPGLGLYRELLNLYKILHFKNADGSLNLKTVVEYTTEILLQHGLQTGYEIEHVDGIYVYPVDYFCPISVDDGKLRITCNTRSIHHYAQSWQSPIRKWGRRIVLLLGGERLKRVMKKVLIK